MDWKKLINDNREELKNAMLEQWKEMLTAEPFTSMRNVVLLWDDGDIAKSYRDQNSFSKGEFDGTAICIASFGGQKDEEVYAEFEEEYGDDAEEEYLDFYTSEYPVNTDEIIENVLEHLEELEA